MKNERKKDVKKLEGNATPKVEALICKNKLLWLWFGGIFFMDFFGTNIFWGYQTFLGDQTFSGDQTFLEHQTFLG